MLRTALEIVAAIWIITGFGVFVWAVYETRQPGLTRDTHTSADVEEQAQTEIVAAEAQEASR
jgi:hypothetical protein